MPYPLILIWSLLLSVAVPADLPAGRGLPPDVVRPDSLVSESLPQGSASAYLLGKGLLERGELREALVHLSTAYLAAPDQEEFALPYLSALLATGQRGEALKVLDALRAVHPDRRDLEQQRALLLADLGRYEDALRQVALVKTLEAAGADSVTVGSLEHDGDLALLEAGLLVQVGRTDEALATYRLLLRDRPEQAEQIYVMMASLIERHGDRAELEQLLREALTVAPDSRPLRLGLLHLLVDDERLEAARNLATTADSLAVAQGEASGDRDGVEAGAQNAAARSYGLELADLLARRGHYREAVAILQQRRGGGRPGEEESLWLGRLLLGLGDGEEAEEVIGEVRARWPDSGWAEYLQGRLLARQRRFDDALPHLRRAAELEPYEPDVRTTLVQILLLAGGSDLDSTATTASAVAFRGELRQQSDAAAAMVQAGDHPGHMVLGHAFRTLGELGRAAEHFVVAAGDPELRLDARVQLAFCKDELGQPEAARELLEQLRREFPEEADLANTLGYMLAERGEDLDHAEQLIRAALKVEPDNGAYLDSLGWVHYQRGEYEAAFDRLVEAANAFPENPVILEHMGLTLRALGRTDEARAVLRRALEAGGDEEHLHRLLAELEEEAKP
ncbi:MAG: tetratricopeptide repeat protein [Candidatus Krumholzibacteriia bacterium]